MPQTAQQSEAIREQAIQRRIQEARARRMSNQNRAATSQATQDDFNGNTNPGSPANRNSTNPTGLNTSPAAGTSGATFGSAGTSTTPATRATGSSTSSASQGINNVADPRPTANRNSTGGFNLQRDFGLSFATTPNASGSSGLTVSQVSEGGTAQALGLMGGDRVLSANGVALGSAQSLNGLLGNPNLQNDISLSVQRGDQTFNLRISPQQLLNNTTKGAQAPLSGASTRTTNAAGSSSSR